MDPFTPLSLLALLLEQVYASIPWTILLGGIIIHYFQTIFNHFKLYQPHNTRFAANKQYIPVRFTAPLPRNYCGKLHDFNYHLHKLIDSSGKKDQIRLTPSNISCYRRAFDIHFRCHLYRLWSLKSSLLAFAVYLPCYSYNISICPDFY